MTDRYNWPQMQMQPHSPLAAYHKPSFWALLLRWLGTNLSLPRAIGSLFGDSKELRRQLAEKDRILAAERISSEKKFQEADSTHRRTLELIAQQHGQETASFNAAIARLEDSIREEREYTRRLVDSQLRSKGLYGTEVLPEKTKADNSPRDEEKTDEEWAKEDEQVELEMAALNMASVPEMLRDTDPDSLDPYWRRVYYRATELVDARTVQ